MSHDGAFRADVPYTAGTGQKAHLLGPRRFDACEAEQDLIAMRGAAAVFPDDPVKAFQAMHAEARRIQDRAKYAREVQEATFRWVSSAASDSEEDDCLVMDEFDPDEWWRDLQDGRATSKAADAKPRKKDLTPLQATEELFMTFRPRIESVDELKRLLESRADPNAPVPEGRITPLQHVMTFAPRETVAKMRDMLLSYGAIESSEDRRDWTIRQDSDLVEDHCTRVFYEDDRHLSPVAAAQL